MAPPFDPAGLSPETTSPAYSKEQLDLSAVEARLEEIFPSPVATSVRTIAEVPLLDEERAFVGNAVERRRWEFATGRQCARLALGALGVPPGPLPSRPDRTVLWPCGVIGSITHCEDIAIAVTAPKSQVTYLGVDVERRGSVTDDLTRLICRPDEMDLLGRVAADLGPDALTVFFCAKEAAFKAHYPCFGIMFAFQSVRLSRGNGTEVLDARIEAPQRGDASRTLRVAFKVVSNWVLCGVAA